MDDVEHGASLSISGQGKIEKASLAQLDTEVKGLQTMTVGGITIYAIGDTDGDMYRLVYCLLSTGKFVLAEGDELLRWNDATTTKRSNPKPYGIFILGNVLGGPDDKAMLKLIRRLSEDEAVLQEATETKTKVLRGSTLNFVLGAHEQKTLMLDLRDEVPEERGWSAEDRIQAMVDPISEDYDLMTWLSERRILSIYGDVLFCSSGLSMQVMSRAIAEYKDDDEEESEEDEGFTEGEVRRMAILDLNTKSNQFFAHMREKVTTLAQPTPSAEDATPVAPSAAELVARMQDTVPPYFLANINDGYHAGAGVTMYQGYTVPEQNADMFRAHIPVTLEWLQEHVDKFEMMPNEPRLWHAKKGEKIPLPLDSDDFGPLLSLTDEYTVAICTPVYAPPLEKVSYSAMPKADNRCFGWVTAGDDAKSFQSVLDAWVTAAKQTEDWEKGISRPILVFQHMDDSEMHAGSFVACAYLQEVGNVLGIEAMVVANSPHPFITEYCGSKMVFASAHLLPVRLFVADTYLTSGTSGSAEFAEGLAAGEAKNVVTAVDHGKLKGFYGLYQRLRDIQKGPDSFVEESAPASLQVTWDRRQHRLLMAKACIYALDAKGSGEAVSACHNRYMTRPDLSDRIDYMQMARIQSSLDRTAWGMQRIGRIGRSAARRTNRRGRDRAAKMGSVPANNEGEVALDSVPERLAAAVHDTTAAAPGVAELAVK